MEDGMGNATKKKKTLHQVWLTGLAKLVKNDLLPNYPLDTVVTYGFPAGRNADDNRGVFYAPKERKKNSRGVILIHPAEWNDPQNVVRVFLHEAVHATLWATNPNGVEEHGPEFHNISASIGLIGDLRCEADNTLQSKIDQWLQLLPEMPKDPLGREAPKPQKGRMGLWVCLCGVKIRAGRKEIHVQCQDCGGTFRKVDQ